MTSFTVTSNLPQVIATVDSWAARLLLQLSAASEALGREGVQALRTAAPRDTGALSEAFRYEVHDEGQSVGVGWSVDAAMEQRLLYVTRGTRPHTIAAHGRAMRIDRGGGAFYRRRVNHPGSRPNDFVPGAFATITPGAFEDVADQFAQEANAD